VTDSTPPVAFELLGWAPDGDGPTLRLDHERFAYAGKFVMSTTGKAVARDRREGTDGGLVAAVAFNADRTEPAALWLRYVTVARGRRGEGIGPRLCAFVVGRAAARGYDRARIAVNNPFAYEALYRAGFAFTGRETGIAELVLERPIDGGDDGTHEDRAASYRDGLDRFRDRDLSAAEREFLRERDAAETPPPSTVEPPDGEA